MRSRETILAELAAKGVSFGDQIVIYCTGGVRSAWLTVVLADLGLNARNYAGSMWEWSAGDEVDYPLISNYHFGEVHKSFNLLAVSLRLTI